MNPETDPHPHDAPELTAYALGELPTADTGEVREWIASDPGARREVAEIEEIADALRHGAPVPTRHLYPDQRHAVLNPPRRPRTIKPLQPQPIAARRRPSGMAAFIGSVARIGLAAAVAVGAFLIGAHMRDHLPAPVGAPETGLAGVKPGQPAPATAAPKAKSTTPVPVKNAAAPEPVVASAGPSAPAPPAPAVVTQAAKPAVVTPAPVRKEPAVAASQPAAAPAKAPVAAKPTAPSGFVAHTIPGPADEFVSTSKGAASQLTLRPYDLRPLPAKQEDKSKSFGSPMPLKAPPAAAPEKPARTPDLLIQSWKAEVASCPWNSANRLMRVVVQLPASQPAVASSSFSYPLMVSFDPNHVRSYRLLCERHIQPPAGQTTAAQVLWYEFLPNGAPAETLRDTGKNVATVTLPAARFTSKTVGPFDSTSLHVIDRGLSWEASREDFQFETSIVGFGLLLRGAGQSGSLNHQMVLDLARTPKDAGHSPERARFIRLVQEAKNAAGL